MTIDLGKKTKSLDVTPAKPGKVPSVSYPSFHVSDVADLNNLPDGHFPFHAIGKVVSRQTSNRNGKVTHSHEIEIHSMKHMPSDKNGGGLDAAMAKIEKDKSSKNT